MQKFCLCFFDKFYIIFKIVFLFIVKLSSRFSFCSIGIFLRNAFDVALPFYNMLTNKIQANKIVILDTGINILLTGLNHQKVQSSILDCELSAVEILHLSLNFSAKCLVQNKHLINIDFKEVTRN